MAPILKLGDPNKDFTVWTDAYMEGLEEVLMQHNSLISYQSRKLKTHERNYVVYDFRSSCCITFLKYVKALSVREEIQIGNWSYQPKIYFHPNIS